MNKSFLQDSLVYLSGPIEFGDGPNWRIDVKSSLKHLFGLKIFDPFEDPKQQFVPALNKARETKDYETIKTITKGFVRKDLCMVDRADFTIAYLPYRVPTTGTVHEIINSSNAKKPTLLVCDRDIAFIPAWYWGFIPQECMFSSWDGLYTYLNDVNQGLHRENRDWHYIYKML